MKMCIRDSLLIYLQHSLGFNIEDLLGYVTKPVLIAARAKLPAVCINEAAKSPTVNSAIAVSYTHLGR